MEILQIYFENPDYLLLLIPLLFLILYYMLFFNKARRKKLTRFGSAVYEKLLLRPAYSYRALRDFFLITALAFLVISAGGPRYGMKEREFDIKGIDMVIAVDVSRSMNAIDIRPSRMERTRLLLHGLLRELAGNRAGFVAFSGIAYVLSPLTADLRAVSMFLDIMNTDLVPIGGTNIEDALNRSFSLFMEDETKYKAIVLFTDGQETTGRAENMIRRLRENRIRLFIIGVAGDRPVPIPIMKDNVLVDYIRDPEGNMVMTYLVDDSLKVLAEQTGGAFYRVGDHHNIIQKVMEDIEKIEKMELQETLFTDLVDRSGLFLSFAFIFLSAYIILSYRTRKADEYDFN